ncbi:MAG: PAS-domain containing protein [Gemmobacter sp.]
MDQSVLVWIAGASLLAALVAILVLGFGRPARRSRSPIFDDGQTGVRFLFDGDAMVDATDEARQLLSGIRLPGSAWIRFLSFAVPRFPGIETQFSTLAETGRFLRTSDGPHPLTLLAEWRGGLRRITLADAHAEGELAVVDPLIQRAQDEELATLRNLADTVPIPLWQKAATGEVVWANPAYVDLACRPGPDGDAGPLWPLPVLFESDGGPGSRCALPAGPDGGVRWFVPTEAEGATGTVGCAFPVDAAVQAEEALRSFVQTLTKTFAQLPIGLAIFDRSRRLQLFNPALTDLTGLPVDFLSARPSFFAFLDAMRDRRMIPEPKNYKSWRAQMAAMERTAAAGQFEETWSLPGGLTYRVFGRPHPEGALALLFQDITDEILRVRGFRADLELGQAVIDALDEAVAVFSPAGHMVMSNTAYSALWNHDPAGHAGDARVGGIVAVWKAGSAPDPLWQEAEAFITRSGPRRAWAAAARLNDGRALNCRFVPLAGGATLACFAPVRPGQAVADAAPARADAGSPAA